MADFEYVLSEDGYIVKNREGYVVCELSDFEPTLIKRFKELLSQSHDLNRAEACLNQMFFQRDTSLIDGALMNTAIQLLIRCFTKSGIDDRMKFDDVKVFRTYAKQIGKADMTRTYRQFYNARNKVIAHDEQNFEDNIIGLTLNSDGLACDLTWLTVSTRFAYEKNKELLLQLIHVAMDYCDEQIDATQNLLIQRFNNTKEKPVLAPINKERLSTIEQFNVW